MVASVESDVEGLVLLSRVSPVKETQQIAQSCDEAVPFLIVLSVLESDKRGLSLKPFRSSASLMKCADKQSECLRTPYVNAFTAMFVGLNKTKTRNSLALDGTLSSIMTIKMADLEPCFKWEPPSDVLKTSKKATGQYNRAHRS
ncbi:unnamed protein product [Boreogadus saida]